LADWLGHEAPTRHLSIAADAGREAVRCPWREIWAVAAPATVEPFAPRVWSTIHIDPSASTSAGLAVTLCALSSPTFQSADRGQESQPHPGESTVLPTETSSA
jgi:hypothetical protein